jgi:flagellar biosynthesis protein FlhG
MSESGFAASSAESGRRRDVERQVARHEFDGSTADRIGSSDALEFVGRLECVLRDDEPVTPPAVVFASGKGGVGKSTLAILAAQAMARAGRRVLLLDGDQHHGNLHVLLGVTPRRSLSDLLDGHIEPEDLLTDVTPGLSLVPSNAGGESLYGLSRLDRARLHRRLSDLYGRFDAVVLDAAPGIECAVRLATIRATRLVAVTAPEPAAISDAAALIRIVRMQAPHLAIDVLVNRTRTVDEGPWTYRELQRATLESGDCRLGDAGEIPEDEALGGAVRRPAGLREAEGPAADAMRALADRLLASDTPRPLTLSLFPHPLWTRPL